MNFLQLEYFCKIAELGNMTRAAEALCVSQPGLSRVLRALEEELEVSLFLRTSRQMELTAEGRELFQGAQEILLTRDRMLERIRLGNQISGSVTFATSLHSNRFDVIRAFQKLYPNVHVELERPAITPEGLQSGVVYLMPYPDDTQLAAAIEAVPVTDEEMVLLVAEDSPYSSSIAVRLQDLKEETFLLESSSVPAYHFLQNLFRQAGFSPKVSPSRNSNKPALVRLGAGIAFTTANHADASAPGVRIVHLREPNPFRRLYLIWNRRLALSPAQSCLVQYIQRAFLDSGDNER